MLGTIIAFCFSYSAYRMARRAGRNVVLWIAMVWILGTVFALLFAFAGIIVDFIAASDEDAESGNVKPYVAFWASMGGMIVGCGIASLLAGRPLPEHAIDAEIVTELPAT